MEKQKGSSLNHNLRCAANLEYIEGSCLSTDELKALALIYNNAIKNKKITGDDIKLVHNKEFLLKELDKRFKSCKGEQLCWLKQDFIEATKDFDPDDFFRPDGTDGKRDWLSDLNIQQAMTQMEKKFEDYLFLGAVPIDFYEINYKNIAKINFDELLVNGSKQKNKEMMEYNLNKFYYNNILLIQEIYKINEKKSFIHFDTFYMDVNKKLDNLNKMIVNLEKKFNSQNYPIEFINIINKQYPNLAADFINQINEIKNKKYPIKKIGIVPNLDEHWKGGSHWVSLFINLETGQIYFFDSYGYRPEKRIRSFLKIIAEWKYKKDTGKTLNFDADNYMKGSSKEKNEIEKKYDIRYSEIRNQYKNSECGVYSMNFIIRLLHNANFDNIISNEVPDDTINKCREIYFNNQDINTDKFNLYDDGNKITVKRGKGYICE